MNFPQTPHPSLLVHVVIERPLKKIFQNLCERNLRMIQNTERVDEWMSSMITKMSMVEDTTNEVMHNLLVTYFHEFQIYKHFSRKMSCFLLK